MVLLFSATPVISSKWRAWNILAVWRTYNWKSGEYPLKEESPVQESLITWWTIYKTLKRRPTSLKDRNLWRTDLMPILGWVICPCPLVAPPFVKMRVMFLWDIIMRSIWCVAQWLRTLAWSWKDLNLNPWFITYQWSLWAENLFISYFCCL